MELMFLRKAPKICIFTETYHPVVGGGETQARSLAEGLVANGYRVIVLTRRSHPSYKKLERFDGYEVYRIGPSGGNHLKKWGLLITSLPALLRLHRKYDLVFVSGFRVVGMSAILISKLFKKVCILKADSLGEMSGDFFTKGLAKLHLSPSFLPFRIFLSVRNKILRDADAFVAISSPIARELISNNLSPDVIREIPNSVDTLKFCPVRKKVKRKLRQKLTIPQSHKIVAFTGRLVSYKGLPLLLRVWRKMHQMHRNLTLLLVGTGGLDMHNCEQELKDYVEVNGLHPSVLFTGAVDNVHEYLKASDLFVFPTEQEAFGISVIEAMACGLPVISTVVGGVKDILQHRKNGIVIEPGNFQQLYDSLYLLISDASLSASLGESARQTVQQRYSLEIVAQEYTDLFLRLVGQGKRDLQAAN
jgi:glycosyltransferase involved in cell wall biosynthesis